MIQRFVPLVLLVLTASVAGALLFFHRLPSPASHPPASAGWLPQETKVYLQVWNATRTLERFRKTDLFELATLPDVQKFLAPAIHNAKRLRRFQEACKKIEAAKIREAFIALISVEMPVPRFVAGFEAESGQDAIRDLIEHPRGELLALFPAAKIDAEKHGRYTLDAVTFENSRIFVAREKNWFFAASDPELLVGVLDRQRRDSEHGSLLASRAFKNTIAPLPLERETLFYVHAAPLLTDLFALLDLQGVALDSKTRMELQKWEAVAATTSIEDGAFRDAIFCLAKEAQQVHDKLKRDTVRAAAEDTVLFLAGRIALPRTQGVEPVVEINSNAFGPLRPYYQAFLDAGLSFEDLGACLGAEFAIGLDWKNSSSQPVPFALVEIGNRNRLDNMLRRLAANLSGAMLRGGKVTPEDNGEEAQPIEFVFPVLSGGRFQLPALQVQPRLKESGRYLVFGLDDLALQVVDARLSPQKKNSTHGERGEQPLRPLTDVEKYREADASAGAADDFFLYADVGRLLTQLSGVMRPLLGLLSTVNPDVAAFLRTAPLPPNEVYDQSLKPTTMVQSSRRDGVLIQSTGSITVPQMMGSLLGLCVAAVMPNIEEMIATGEFPSAVDLFPHPDAFQEPSGE